MAAMMEQTAPLKRINVGCGDVPTPGWVNYDNSLSARLARLPRLAAMFDQFGLLSERQKRFIAVVREDGIRYADAVRRIPEADGSVEVLYTCHMLEHLDRREAGLFLREARRVLAPRGIVRIAVPDIGHHVENYLRDRDADSLVENLFMAAPRPVGLIERAKSLLIGERHHLWMYDGGSLCRLLLGAGFSHPRVMPAGETMIPRPGALNLAERASESVFVEAINP